MNTITAKAIPLFMATVSLLTVSIPASTAEYSGLVRAGVGVSDNVIRSARSETDETMVTLGLDFGMNEQSRRLDLTLRSSFDYINYLDDTYDAEWVGGLSADADFTLVEERVRWVIQDNFGQQLFNPLQPATPNNREDINYFRTGPTINLLPASRNSITLDARYGRVDYENRPADNDRLSGTLSFGRDLSHRSTVSVNLEGERVEFDEAMLAPPYERYSGYVRYETRSDKSTLRVDVGHNQVEYEGIEGDGVLLGISWSTKTSANAVLSVSAGSRYSDQGDIFRILQNITPQLGDTNDLSDTSAPFLYNSFSVGYELERDRYTVNATIGGFQEDYKGGLSPDRDIYRGHLELRRQVSRTVFAGALVRLDRREYKYEDRRDDDLTVGLNVGYRIGSGFHVTLDYQHFQRNSITRGADYTENRAFVRVAYTPRWSRRDDN